MKFFSLKKLFCMLLAATFLLGLCPLVSLGAVNEPLLTIACISDLHTDYGLQNKSPYVRNSVLQTLHRIGMEEDADLLLVGGDNTSDNGNTSHRGGWTYSTFSKVMDEYAELSELATESGRSLWACGNHDHEAGEDNGYDPYADLELLMKETCGEPLDTYRQKQDKSLRDQQYPEHLLGVHYQIEGFDFLIINAPYGQTMQYSSGTCQWLSRRLASIGKNRTVFLLTHYPLTDFHGLSTPDYGVQGASYNRLYGILSKYPNLIYLHGHDHGNSKSVYIEKDTFERITWYNENGWVVRDRDAVPTSFIASFMGSMSYYMTTDNPATLGARDPTIVQALMIYVYEGRIVFQMKNYGTKFAKRELDSWTVRRDVLGASAEEEETSSTENAFLVSEDLCPNLIYDSSLSIGEGHSPSALESPVILKSFKTTLEGYGISSDDTLSVKTLTSVSGKEYDALEGALKDVVTCFVAQKITVKGDGEAISPQGTVRITVPLPNELESESELSYAAYYLDENGRLNMTDAVVSDDGKTMSFCLPRLTPFALSQKAVAKDLRSEGDMFSMQHSSPPPIIWICGGILLVCVLGAGAAIILIRRNKGKNKK